MAHANKHADARARKPLTQERLKELLHYDPETGIFTRKVRAGNRLAGAAVGCETSGGHRGRTYVVMCIDYTKIYVHQAAFLYMTGHIPPMIDHADNNGANNRWENLRQANATQNMANAKTRRTSRSGVKGVYWHAKDRRWMARIQVAKKQIYLGNFESMTSARAAYERAAREHFGEFARTM